MVEMVREKWCDDLEDILQCPVCMERPKNWIYQCIQGHHICQICKPQLQRCPTCTEIWSDSRNRLAEHLCSKLDEIKLSLVDPENEINKLLIPETVSASSQTEEVAGAEQGAAQRLINSHGGKPYPCKIGNCSVFLFYEPLMNHMQQKHASEFSKLTSDGSVFEHSWNIDIKEQMAFDRAFSVANIGSFVLKLSTDVFLNLTGFVLMINNGFVSKQFAYQLEICCCSMHDSAIYTGEVCSCRTPTSILLQKCLRVERSQLQRMLHQMKPLTCTLLISKKYVFDENLSTKLKNGKKHRQQNPRYEKDNEAKSECLPRFHYKPRSGATSNQRKGKTNAASSISSDEGSIGWGATAY